MTYPQQIQFAIYSAEQVIDIFEKQHLKDDRPRKAIQAAKDFLADKIDQRAVTNAAESAALNKKIMNYGSFLLGE